MRSLHLHHAQAGADAHGDHEWCSPPRVASRLPAAASPSARSAHSMLRMRILLQGPGSCMPLICAVLIPHFSTECARRRGCAPLDERGAAVLNDELCDSVRLAIGHGHLHHFMQYWALVLAMAHSQVRPLGQKPLVEAQQRLQKKTVFSKCAELLPKTVHLASCGPSQRSTS